MEERLGIAGSGAIACGLAATAAQHGDVLLWARSEGSAERARGAVAKWCGKLSEEPIADRVTVVVGPRRARARDVPRRGRCGGPRRRRTRCWRELGARLRATTPSSRRRPRRCRSRAWRRRGRPGRASSACTSSTRCRRWRSSSWPSPPRRSTPYASAPARCARRSGRPPSRCRTSPASSSTACCSPTCSAPSSCMEQTGLRAGGDRHLHAARRRTSDGPARAARLRRPRRLEGDRRGDRVAASRRRCERARRRGPPRQEDGPRAARLRSSMRGLSGAA